MKIHGIYRIINQANEKCYVGSSVDLQKRLNEHLLGLKKNKHHSIKLQRSWNIHGESNFLLEILENVKEKSKLILREQFWINFYDSYNNGYNCTKKAGSRLGCKHTEKTKLKMSKLKKGKPSNRKGCKLSSETKEKLRKANIGKKLSSSTVNKMIESRKGYKMTKEANNKISKASGLKNYYSVLNKSGSIIELNFFRNYCLENNINFKALHAWSKNNLKNDLTHPKYGIKILKLRVCKKLN